MQAKRFRPNPNDEFFTEEKCHILEIVNTPTFKDYSLAQARVESGITTEWHWLKDTDELYYILSGVGLMEIGDDFKKEVKSGDAIFIPKMEKQRIHNTSDSDLVFLCICTPRWEAGNYLSQTAK